MVKRKSTDYQVSQPEAKRKSQHGAVTRMDTPSTIQILDQPMTSQESTARDLKDQMRETEIEESKVVQETISQIRNQLEAPNDRWN